MADMIWVMSDYYDPTVSRDDYHKQVNDLALYYFLIAIGALICNTGTKTLFSRVGEGLTYRLRLDVFKKIVHMPVHWFDIPEHNPGTLAVRLGSEAKMVNNLTSNVIDLQVGLVSCFGTALIIGFYYSWAITLVAIALAPIQIFAGALRAKFVQGFSSQTDEAYKDSGNLIQESVTNIRTVASFGNEKILLGFLDERLKKPAALIFSKANVAGLSLGFSQLTLFVIYALVFYIGAILHRDDGLTMKDMIAAIFAIMFASMRAGMNLHFAGDIGDAQNAAINIF
jgi:ATP-binding cassette subfamily B (MDR/TAP) protein 1